MSFRERFTDLAESVGDVEALLAPGRAALPFKEIPRLQSAIRDRLAEAGIGPGDRVAAALPDGPETATCFLCVASCAVFAPLNPDYTEAEFREYFSLLAPKIVIVPRGGGIAARHAAEEAGVPLVELVVPADERAGIFDLDARQERIMLPAHPRWNGPEDFALILATSGTTGRQKFVPHRIRHLLAYADAGRHHYALTAEDRCLHVMPMFHGHGVKSSLTIPLASGSGVACSSGHDISAFFRNMAAFRPTWYSASYAIHSAISDRVDEFADIAAAAGLRFIRSGSGRLDRKVAEKLEQAFGAPVLERYGMSETATLTANGLHPADRRAGTVGRLFSGEVAVIDETGKFLDTGAAGEVVARGPTVFDGYLDDPEATDKAFIDGWFRTGDLGAFDEDGFLRIVGRIKDLINRGGEKIGTLEVETALAEHAGVREACVFAIPHPVLGEEVGAAFISANGPAPGEADLRAHCRQRLAAFKVPRRIFRLDSFPRSGTNKVRRNEVAAICRAHLEAESSQAAADDTDTWSATEREIGTFWEQALGERGLRRDQDFFLIGGDSLKAAELIAHLQTTFQVQVTLGDIFDDAATIAGMARIVERSRRSARSSAVRRNGIIPIKPDGSLPPLFACPGTAGNPVGFASLARLLPDEQPLLGLESRGLDGLSSPIDRMEDIAADNVGRIKSVQAEGPYFIMGACFGGRVAYETARQLMEAGDEIGLLVMLDPSAPFHNADGRLRRPDPASAPTGKQRGIAFRSLLKNRLNMYRQEFIGLGGRERFAFCARKARTIGEALRYRDRFRDQLRQRAAYEANRRAGRHYMPPGYRGPVVLFFTADRPVRGERNFRDDWIGILPQAGRALRTPGKDSDNMLTRPNVDTLALLLTKELVRSHQTSAILLSAAE